MSVRFGLFRAIFAADHYSTNAHAVAVPGGSSHLSPGGEAPTIKVDFAAPDGDPEIAWASPFFVNYQ